MGGHDGRARAERSYVRCEDDGDGDLRDTGVELERAQASSLLYRHPRAKRRPRAVPAILLLRACGSRGR